MHIKEFDKGIYCISIYLDLLVQTEKLNNKNSDAYCCVVNDYILSAHVAMK